MARHRRDSLDHRPALWLVMGSGSDRSWAWVQLLVGALDGIPLRAAGDDTPAVAAGCSWVACSRGVVRTRRHMEEPGWMGWAEEDPGPVLPLIPAHTRVEHGTCAMKPGWLGVDPVAMGRLSQGD